MKIKPFLITSLFLIISSLLVVGQTNINQRDYKVEEGTFIYSNNREKTSNNATLSNQSEKEVKQNDELVRSILTIPMIFFIFLMGGILLFLLFFIVMLFNVDPT